MGFFSKIKQGFSQLVGGTGNMQIQLDTQQAARGGTVNVSLTLNATGPLKGNSVNLELTGVETVKYRVPATNLTDSGSPTSGANRISLTTSSTDTVEETKDNQTYSNRQILDGTSFNMNQGETRNYSGAVQIPPTALPTYKGVDAVHVWKIRAYVDVPMGADIEAVAEVTVA